MAKTIFMAVCVLQNFFASLANITISSSLSLKAPHPQAPKINTLCSFFLAASYKEENLFCKYSDLTRDMLLSSLAITAHLKGVIGFIALSLLTMTFLTYIKASFGMGYFYFSNNNPKFDCLHKVSSCVPCCLLLQDPPGLDPLAKSKTTGFIPSLTYLSAHWNVS